MAENILLAQAEADSGYVLLIKDWINKHENYSRKCRFGRTDCGVTSGRNGRKDPIREALPRI